MNADIIRAGIILFSFSSFLSVYSDTSKIACNIAYVIYMLGIIIFIIRNKRYNISRFKVSLCILLLMLIYLFIGMHNNNPDAVSDDLRGFYFPVCIALLLYVSDNKLSNKEIREIISTYITCALINSIAGIIQVMTFKGDFSKLYIGQFAVGAEYNFFRAGHLRAYGFMASPVTLSLYLSMAVVTMIIYGNNTYGKRQYFLILALLLLSIYLTNCMVPLGSTIVTIIIYKFTKNNVYIMLLAPALILLAMIFLLSHAGQLFNLSAVGRIQQYNIGFDIFKHNLLGMGTGFSSYPFGTYIFDPSILTFVDNYGIPGLLIAITIYIRTNLNNRVSVSARSLILNLILISLFSNIFSTGNLIISITLIHTLNAYYENESKDNKRHYKLSENLIPPAMLERMK